MVSRRGSVLRSKRRKKAAGGSGSLHSTHRITEQSVKQIDMAVDQRHGVKAGQRAEEQLQKPINDKMMGASARAANHSMSGDSEENSPNDVSDSVRGVHLQAAALDPARDVAKETRVAGKASVPIGQASEDQLTETGAGIAEQTPIGMEPQDNSVQDQSHDGAKPIDDQALTSAFATRWTRAAHVLEANLTAKLQAEKVALSDRALVMKQAAKAKKSWMRALSGSPSAAQVGDLLTQAEGAAERAYKE